MQLTTPGAQPPHAATPLAALRPRSVAVFRALQLGDMLCAVPTLRALRRALPQARVTLIGLPWARDLAVRCSSLVDDFLAFPGDADLPEQPVNAAAWPAFEQAVRERDFDLAIQLHGDGSRSNALVRRLGARMQAGFAPQHDDSGLFLPYPQQGAEVRRLLSLAAFLGADARDERLEFPLTAADDAHWQAYPAVHALVPGRYVCLHPGARAADKRWPPEHFATVGDAVARATGLTVVLTGSGEETALTAAVAAAMGTPTVDAAAPVPVGALAALIARSRLLVSNDTGSSHLAAALGVPSVVVFRASDLARWAPLDTTRHRTVWDPQGVRRDDVLGEALDLLQQTR